MSRDKNENNKYFNWPLDSQKSLEVPEYFCTLIFNAKNNFAKLITAFRDFFEFVPFGFIVFPNGGNVFEYKDIKTFLKTVFSRVKSSPL